MPRIARSETVLPKNLSDREKDELARELLEPYQEIFSGSDFKYVREQIVEPKSDLTTLLVHRSEEGKVVGLFAIHFFDKTLRGETVTVVRSTVGTLRAYRGQNSNISWALEVLARRKLEHPKRALYGLGAMAHPSSYLQVDRYVDTFWPRRDEPVPADIERFMFELGEEFGLPCVDPTKPFVRAVRIATRETAVESNYWRQSDKPAARFFLSMNPGYAQGRGLLTLFPITPRMLAVLAGRIARDRASLVAEGLHARALASPLGARLLRAGEVRRRLRAAKLFASLAEPALEKLVASAEVFSLPAARFLLRAGEEGSDLYLLARGAVQVLDNADGGEVLIDQLGAGALFGEIGMLAGGKRTASVRTAIPSTFVRIPGSALRSLMNESPDLADAVWSAFAARTFDDHLREHGLHPELGRLERLAWVQRAVHSELEPGASVAADREVLLVLRGSVTIQQGAAKLSAQAPMVLEPTAATKVTALTAARVARVPSLNPNP